MRAIALYLEADGDLDRWCDALTRCPAAGIGVAVLKAGATRAGAAAAGAHTGAVAGDQRIVRAFFEEAGAAWAEDPHDLLELAKALATRGGRRDRRGVAVMTCSGGDSRGRRRPRRRARRPAARAGAARPLARLRAVLPAAATAANPLDYTTLLWDDHAALKELVLALADDPGGRAGAGALRRRGVRGRVVGGGARCGRGGRASSAVPVTVASTLPELAAEGAIAGLRSGLRAVQAAAGPA